MSTNVTTPFTAHNGDAASTRAGKGHTHVVRFCPRTLVPQAPPAPAPAPPATPAQREWRIRAACDALRDSGHVRMTSEATRDAEGNVRGIHVGCKYCDGAVFLQGTEHEFRRLIMLHVRACDTPCAQAAYARALDADKENSA